MPQPNVSIYDKLEELFAYVSEEDYLDEDKVTLDLFLILASAQQHLPHDAVYRLRNALGAKIETKLPGYMSRTFSDTASPTSVMEGI